MSKQTVPLYNALPGTPGRRVIGSCEVDTDTGRFESTITDDEWINKLSPSVSSYSIYDDSVMYDRTEYNDLVPKGPFV